MGKIIVKNAVERRKGYLYYINGNGDICEAEMARGKKKKTVKKVIKKTTNKKPIKKSK